jgi:hypothetical protein
MDAFFSAMTTHQFSEAQCQRKLMIQRKQASEARPESASVAGASDAAAQRCEGLAGANECKMMKEAALLHQTPLVCKKLTKSRCQRPLRFECDQRAAVLMPRRALQTVASKPSTRPLTT